MNPFQILFLVFLTLLFSATCIDFVTTQYILTGTEDLTGWLEDQPLAVALLVFAGACAAFSVACVTLTAMALAGGYLFTVLTGSTAMGVIYGTVATTLGGTLGAAVTFVIARYMLYDCGQEWLAGHRWLQGMDAVLASNGLRMNFLLRLTPLVPFAACNYLLPATSTSFADYLAGCVGMAPWFFACAYFGSMVDGVAELATQYSTWSTGEIVVYALGTVVLVATVVLMVRWTKRVIEEEVERASSGGGSSAAGSVADLESLPAAGPMVGPPLSSRWSSSMLFSESTLSSYLVVVVVVDGSLFGFDK